MQKHTRIALIVEDHYCEAYRILTKKVWPDRVRGYPFRKNKSIPATPKLREWIKQCKDKGKYDFVLVLVDLDTPAHNKDPEYFRKLRRICADEGAALLVVKRELESWILADVDSIARWKLGDNTSFTLKVYHNTARSPLEPKKEILKLVHQVAKHRKQKLPRYDPAWTERIAERVNLSDAVLKRNSSLRCFYDLVKGCASDKGQQHFAAYPPQAHCNSAQIPD